MRSPSRLNYPECGIRWLLLGTSAHVHSHMENVVPADYDAVITCNGGLQLWPAPDVYIACDMAATVKWAQDARWAQQQGTRLVTLKRHPKALKERNSDWYDEFITEGKGDPTRSSWGNFHYTGPLTLEYALRHNASQVTIVGCDGYRTGLQDDYAAEIAFAPIKPSTTAPQRTAEVLAPGFERIARIFPEVPIIQYGDPCYSIDSPNWEVVSCPSPC